MSGIDFASAQKQALLAAANAQSIADGEKVGRRDKPSTLGVNPVCKVVAYIRNVRQGTDAAANYLASGDVDEDTELYRAVAKLASGRTLSQGEYALVAAASKESPRLTTALQMYGSSVSQRSSQRCDLSECVQNFSLSKSLKVQGGSCQLRIQVDSEDVARGIGLGDQFYIYLDEQCIFWGMCMEVTYPDEWNIDFTINDSMWYLKNQLVWIQNKPTTLDAMFTSICDQLALPYVRPAPIPVALKPRVETNATAMSLLQNAIDETMYYGGRLFAIRMNPAALELIEVQGEDKQGVTLDVIEAMTSFSATQSIQNETYNEVRVFANNSGGTLKAYTLQDLPFMERFGILRYQEVCNNAIIREGDLDKMLAVTKYPTGDLRFDIVGVVNLFPADVIRLMESVYVTHDISYNYDDAGYKMTVTCARWQKPSSEQLFDKWDFSQEYAQAKHLKW